MNSATVHEHDITARGLRQHVLRAGPPGAPPLLLLHGWPEWSHVWRPVMAGLADRFDLIAPDFRGFGDTRQPTTGPSRAAGPDVLAADVLALADALGLARFGLVSHDVGSFVAQVIARQAPERVRGLFFFNCAHPRIGPRWVEPDHLTEVWYQFFHQQSFAAALVGSSREACRIYLRHFLHHWAYRTEAFDDVAMEAWVDNFLKPGNLQGGFDWYLSVHQARMAVVQGRVEPPPPLPHPTRVLWGAHDPVLKAEWTDRLPEVFTNLRVDRVPDAGHFVHWERPDLAAREIGAFFDGLPA